MHTRLDYVKIYFPKFALSKEGKTDRQLNSDSCTKLHNGE